MAFHDQFDILSTDMGIFKNVTFSLHFGLLLTHVDVYRKQSFWLVTTNCEPLSIWFDVRVCAIHSLHYLLIA